MADIIKFPEYENVILCKCTECDNYKLISFNDKYEAIAYCNTCHEFESFESIIEDFNENINN